ncbi:MAG: DUF1573 domain-containing protein [Bacteroidetes bacterium]|nr:DUF1573 domain-containing protein [Bacteroidota bacterium]
MKKAILSIGVVLCLVFASNAQESTTTSINPNAPDMKFETEVMDYGLIEHGSNGVREFKFKNVGKEPLIITNAVGSCGCTTPEWPKEPIKPGGSGVIKVKYDTQRVGNFEKTVTLTSNAKEANKVIRIKGSVKAAPAAPAEGEKKAN